MRLSRYFLLLVTVWVIAMTWRIYPQFGDGLRIDGRVTSVEQYIDDSCAQRVGPAAQTCLAEAAGEAQILLRREQGKSLLLIAAPILLYLLAYLPKAVAGAAANRRRNFLGAVLFALCAASWALAPPEARAGGSQEQESQKKNGTWPMSACAPRSRNSLITRPKATPGARISGAPACATTACRPRTARRRCERTRLLPACQETRNPG